MQKRRDPPLKSVLVPTINISLLSLLILRLFYVITDVTGRHQTCVSVPSRFVEVKKLIDLAPRERQQNNNTKSQIAVVERWRIEKSNESQSGYFR